MCYKIISLDDVATILLVDIIVLALSSRVNQFQEFFCALLFVVWDVIITDRSSSSTVVADLFPLALSIITLVVVVVM